MGEHNSIRPPPWRNVQLQRSILGHLCDLAGPGPSCERLATGFQQERTESLLLLRESLLLLRESLLLLRELGLNRFDFVLKSGVQFALKSIWS